MKKRLTVWLVLLGLLVTAGVVLAQRSGDLRLSEVSGPVLAGDGTVMRFVALVYNQQSANSEPVGAELFVRMTVDAPQQNPLAVVGIEPIRGTTSREVLVEFVIPDELRGREWGLVFELVMDPDVYDLSPNNNQNVRQVFFEPLREEQPSGEEVPVLLETSPSELIPGEWTEVRVSGEGLYQGLTVDVDGVEIREVVVESPNLMVFAARAREGVQQGRRVVYLFDSRGRGRVATQATMTIASGQQAFQVPEGMVLVSDDLLTLLISVCGFSAALSVMGLNLRFKLIWRLRSLNRWDKMSTDKLAKTAESQKKANKSDEPKRMVDVRLEANVIVEQEGNQVVSARIIGVGTKSNPYEIGIPEAFADALEMVVARARRGVPGATMMSASIEAFRQMAEQLWRTSGKVPNLGRLMKLEVVQENAKLTGEVEIQVWIGPLKKWITIKKVTYDKGYGPGVMAWEFEAPKLRHEQLHQFVERMVEVLENKVVQDLAESRRV